MASFAAIIDIAVSTYKVCKKCYKCSAEDKKDENDDKNESEDGSDSELNTKTEKKTKTKSSAAKTKKKRSKEYKPVKRTESETKTTQPQALPQTTVENHFNPVFNIINSPYAPPSQIPDLPGFKAGPSSSAAPRPGDDILEWVPSSIEKAGELYQKAVIGGKDIDNSDLWIIRARVYGEMIPGKLNNEHSLAFVAYKREDKYVEKNIEVFEVLCVAPEHRHRIIWIQCCDGSVMKNAVIASAKNSEQTLYIGRVIHKDNKRELKSLCPGMVHPNRGLYITFNFEVYLYNSFEVMCLE